MNGSALKYGIATGGCGFDYVVNGGVEFFKMSHGYPLLNTNRTRPELAKKGRYDDVYAKPRYGIRAYEKLRQLDCATDSS
jgi:hypothetical protein